MSVAASSSQFAAITHSPDQYAARENEGLADRLARIRSRAAALEAMAGASPLPSDLLPSLIRRHEQASQAYWRSLSRCMSWAIVGPARFPTARNEKRNRVADRRRDEVQADLTRAIAALDRAAFPYGLPGAPVRGNDPDAIDKLRAKVAELEKARAFKKACNAYARKGDWAGLASFATVKIADSAKALQAQGIAPFDVSNLTAEQRRVEKRIEELTARRESTPEAVEVAGVQLVENPEADRVQLMFPGKPDPETRALLKRHAFRYSPTNDAWQRHLNNAGRYAAKQVLAALSEAA